jgi:hypothetical protein
VIWTPSTLCLWCGCLGACRPGGSVELFL